MMYSKEGVRDGGNARGSISPLCRAFRCRRNIPRMTFQCPGLNKLIPLDDPRAGIDALSFLYPLPLDSLPRKIHRLLCASCSILNR